VLKYSTSATTRLRRREPSTEYGSGGGFVTISDTTIFASTIDHNLADAAGGVSIRGSGETQATIALTTISSNVGTLGIGALDTMADLTLRGSTIAFNTSGPDGPRRRDAEWKYDRLAEHDHCRQCPMDLAAAERYFGNNSLVKIAAPGTLVSCGGRSHWIQNSARSRSTAVRRARTHSAQAVLRSRLDPIAWVTPSTNVARRTCATSAMLRISAHMKATTTTFSVDAIDHPYAL
jgi:hypothetical protein